jgi:hypothetical protein
VRAGCYAIALVGVGVLAAGCGTVHASQSGTPDTLVSAVSHTAAQTARITITETIQATGMSFSFTQTGEFDFAHSRGMISMTAPTDLTELFLPAKVYLRFSSAGSTPLPHGKTWLEVGTGSSGALGSALGPFGTGSDPADMLGSLTAIAGSERILGSTRVRGVPVTEYQVNIDPAKLAAKAPGSERASLRQFAQGLGQGTVPVDVWVDTRNQVRQVRVALHMPDGAGMPGNPRLTETVGFYDFGVQVRVSAPPAAQVASMGSAGTNGLSIGTISSASASASAGASASAAPPAVSASAVPAQG